MAALLLRDHKSGCRLRAIAFGVTQVTPKAKVQDRCVRWRVRNSPENHRSRQAFCYYKIVMLVTQIETSSLAIERNGDFHM